MKKSITALLTLAMIVCVIPALAVFAEESQEAIPELVEVSTADELLDYIRLANDETAKNANATAGKTLSIVEDVDLSGKTWEPLTRWLGTLEGNGYTLSNINYSTDAAEENVGIVAKLVTNNDNIKGAIYDLTLQNCTVTATNAEKVGGIAGMTDRGRIESCKVDSCTVTGGKIVGGIAGRTSYASDDIGGEPYLLLTENTVSATTVKGTEIVGGLIGLIRSDDVTYDITGWSVDGNTLDVADGAQKGEVYGAAQKCYVLDADFLRRYADDGALLEEISQDDGEDETPAGTTEPSVTTDPAISTTPTTTTETLPTVNTPAVNSGASEENLPDASDAIGAKDDGSVLPIVIGVVAAVAVIAVIAVVVMKKKKQ
ncbi:MAG: hypothetical protein IJX47_02035 [Clostridia bacterium]|nr:hypothetical protein [Clostridia bacterium]